MSAAPEKSKRSTPARANAETLEARVRELEERIAWLEQHIESELPEVPWDVITAAVAAVFPNSRILSARPSDSPAKLPRATINFWSLGGRLNHFQSHQVR